MHPKLAPREIIGRYEQVVAISSLDAMIRGTLRVFRGPPLKVADRKITAQASMAAGTRLETHSSSCITRDNRS